ncbi:MAG: hypothetical protein KIB43_12095 [Clostridium baratii]|uniref:YCII-related domain-containing protein n=1 Tax=Clostridium baratii str. Sullivan TaxID=1415775 RepID=A0A0A7FWS3_9CLOT|nr:hypothetical protein [Clostridium baratii]AIY84038.1 hypothetical protein U729_376 [Clostridium baratii str. Sullivan]MBS6007687.1 hypothetical protein [Clostridium baratii]MDU1054479.1 hypothetical protein [Clostridium baratii]MDU4911543.1 hypothetical protein [Clostridium baratii]CUP59028.1 Uncharacterised protein [Clostridium baratii]
MRYFMVEGTIKNPDLINDNIMKEHMAYSKKAMDKGLILMSSLKSDTSGGLFVMIADSIEKIEQYLSNEPLKVYKIQDYKITEFNPHYFNQSLANDLVNDK